MSTKASVTAADSVSHQCEMLGTLATLLEEVAAGPMNGKTSPPNTKDATSTTQPQWKILWQPKSSDSDSDT